MAALTEMQSLGLVVPSTSLTSREQPTYAECGRHTDIVVLMLKWSFLYLSLDSLHLLLQITNHSEAASPIKRQGYFPAAILRWSL